MNDSSPVNLEISEFRDIEGTSEPLTLSIVDPMMPLVSLIPLTIQECSTHIPPGMTNVYVHAHALLVPNQILYR